MSQENEAKWNLFNCLTSVTTIECDKCHKIEEYDGDTDDCIDTIIEDGWYATKNQKVYCESCNKKRKNKKP